VTVTTAVARRDDYASLAIRPGQEMFSDKQRAALGVLGIKNATNADLAVFMHYCQKTGLDPFSRQIYMICRREKQGDQWVDKQTIQVGIGGFQVIRDRIAERLGISVEYEDTIWYDADGSGHGVWLWEHAPVAAKVVVLKNGRRFPGVCRTAAYMQRNKQGEPAGQWKTQPDHMIEKCAEAFALRRAFPHDLSGVYIEEEMAAAPPVIQQHSTRVTAEEVTRRPEPEPDPSDAEPVNGSASTADRATSRPAPAGKAALEKLDELVTRLQLEDVAELFGWLCGAEWTASRKQVQEATVWLESHLEAAEGDSAVAGKAAWDQWRKANPQGDGGA
jgi:phage recombination protein Bet